MHSMDQANSPLLSRSNSVPEHISISRPHRNPKHSSVKLAEKTTVISPNDQKPSYIHHHSSLHGHVNLARRSSENIVVHFAAATPIESPGSNTEEPLASIIAQSADASINKDQLLSAISLSDIANSLTGNHVPITQSQSVLHLHTPSTALPPLGKLNTPTTLLLQSPSTYHVSITWSTRSF